MSFSTLTTIELLTGISLLADESVLGKSIRPGVQWRWWRQTRQKNPWDNISDQGWMPQLDVVPSAATLRQFLPGKC